MRKYGHRKGGGEGELGVLENRMVQWIINYWFSTLSPVYVSPLLKQLSLGLLTNNFLDKEICIFLNTKLCLCNRVKVEVGSVI